VHLVYGAEDWDAIDKAATHMGGKPKRDVTGDDGMTISVGDASLRIVTMPGHTPGTLSYLFEIRNNGKPLRVAYVGGTAIPFNADPQYYDRYIASSKKVAKAAADYGATALITNHTEFDNAFYKSHTAADRRDGEANPFDVGADGVARYFEVVQNCAAADKLRAIGKYGCSGRSKACRFELTPSTRTVYCKPKIHARRLVILSSSPDGLYLTFMQLERQGTSSIGGGAEYELLQIVLGIVDVAARCVGQHSEDPRACPSALLARTRTARMARDYASAA